MNILIVEDDITKSSQIENCLSVFFSSSIITKAMSYNSGIEVLEKEEFDLLILDMSMTTYDNGLGRHRSFAGRDILYEMERLDIIIPTIIITGFSYFGEGAERINFDELDIKLSNEFETVYLGMIRYDSSYLDWEQELILKLNERKG